MRILNWRFWFLLCDKPTLSTRAVFIFIKAFLCLWTNKGSLKGTREILGCSAVWEQDGTGVSSPDHLLLLPKATGLFSGTPPPQGTAKPIREPHLGRTSFLTAPLLQHFIHIPLLSTHPLGPYSVSGSGTVGPSSLAASPLPTGMGGGSRLSAEALFLWGLQEPCPSTPSSWRGTLQLELITHCPHAPHVLHVRRGRVHLYMLFGPFVVEGIRFSISG